MNGQSPIVTLGPEGTYSSRVARAIDDRVRFQDTVTEIIASLDDGAFERAVIPIETGIEGSVTESLDALSEASVAVTRELVAPIDYAILGQHDQLETIASHPKAIAHFESTIQDGYPDVNTTAVSSTVRGVERAIEDSDVGAVAHPSTASKDPSIRILDEVQARETDVTRFFVLGPVKERSDVGTKSSLIVYPSRDGPGILVDLLRCFATHDINIARVDARPSGKRLGDYVIHVDFEAGYYEQRTKDAIAELNEQIRTEWVQSLGSYDVDEIAI
ncbi:prephenate dehydratase [Halorubellus sp. JP-L1]|uniref:prephenate dehydratase n=1 Tax=Halorubellus sp. JP-L1 TaxID=2715753 RepID=UPI001409CAC3|nr:prephenate dehydratase domain-containing protein [Halorubellus sp. JP-L1]NHN42925.1 prephenate dehydratase [Halorubellus sp. JP-L1]